MNNDAGTVSSLEASRMLEARRLNGQRYAFMAIFVLLLSMCVIYLLNHKPFFFNAL